MTRATARRTSSTTGAMITSRSSQEPPKESKFMPRSSRRATAAGNPHSGVAIELASVTISPRKAAASTAPSFKIGIVGTKCGRIGIVRARRQCTARVRTGASPLPTTTRASFICHLVALRFRSNVQISPSK